MTFTAGYYPIHWMVPELRPSPFRQYVMIIDNDYLTCYIINPRLSPADLAFKTSPLWGVGCLLLAPVSLAYLVMHWKDAKNPFLLQLAGVGGFVLGMMGGGTV